MQKKCEFCGKDYEPKTRRSRFCSDYCRHRAFMKAKPGYRGRDKAWTMQKLPQEGPKRGRIGEKDVTEAVLGIRTGAATLDAASVKGPEGLRSACKTVSVAVVAVLEEVGL